MVTLYFTKRFTKSHLLCGLHYHGSIAYPTTEGCMDWLRGVEKNAKRIKYVIVDRSFQNYVR